MATSPIRSETAPVIPVSADRRAFLAAGMASVAAIGAFAPGIAQPSTLRAEWDAAMAAYTYALAAERHYHDHVFLPEDVASIDEGRRFSSAIQSHWEGLIDDVSARRRELMDIPAPDRSALRQKFDVIFAMEDGAVPAWTEEFLSQTMADIARLVGEA